MATVNWKNVSARLRRIFGNLDELERLTRITAKQYIDYQLHLPRYADTKTLVRYGFQVCSQNYEDGMLHEIFKRVGVTTRVFVEIGVGDGKENNTAFLLSQGWTGFWFDGNGAFTNELSRADLSGYVKYKVSFITAETVAALFSSLSVPQEFDLLSIDIDQNTYYVWEALLEYRPRVAVVEYNAAIPAEVEWKAIYDPNRLWNHTQNFGASLKALERLGERLGYHLVGCDFLGVNAFFVRADLTQNKFLAPFTAENHYEPPRYEMSMRMAHANAILDRVQVPR